MRCYTVTTSSSRGIAVKSNSLQCGEEGRGRSLGRIPVLKFLNGEDRLLDCLDIVFATNGKALALPEKQTSDNLLLLLAVPAGYRGSTDIILPLLGWETIVEGYSAQGDAGLMGGHKEFIGIIEPGVRIIVQRHGRCYGEPQTWEISNIGGELLMETPEARLEREALYEFRRGVSLP